MKEEVIRSQQLIDDFLEFAEKDVQTFFGKSKYVDMDCPACDSSAVPSFVRKGFQYVECLQCETLFVSPRPPKEDFDRYYSDSASLRFWATHFYGKTEAARRKNLIEPKVDLVLNLLKTHAPATSWVADIGAGYGVFLEVLREKAGNRLESVAIEPSGSLSQVCVDKGLPVIKMFLEDIDRTMIERDGQGSFVSFELVEHVVDPEAFFKKCAAIMKQGELFIFTMLSGIGMDIQVLWENSNSVHPPHHLNFFNPTSIEMLVAKAGFEVLEVQTPGNLDVDILCNNIEYIKDRFWKRFAARATASQKEKMQKYLRDNLLSSHMMVVARKG